MRTINASLVEEKEARGRVVANLLRINVNLYVTLPFSRTLYFLRHFFGFVRVTTTNCPLS